VIGVAGAGKTSLIRELCERGTGFAVGEDIQVRRPSHLVQFLRAVPAVGAQCAPGQGGRVPSWDEVKSLAYLSRWHRVLASGDECAGDILLLDQGPLFRLATLHAFGPPRLQRPVARAWWNQMFDRWSALAVIVWLDAIDDVLVERIKTREQKHAVKERSHQEIVQFVLRYRASYGHVIGRLLAVRPVPVLRLDTSRATPRSLADAVLLACEAEVVSTAPETVVASNHQPSLAVHVPRFHR
jgi:hypothetical protein